MVEQKKHFTKSKLLANPEKSIKNVDVLISADNTGICKCQMAMLEYEPLLGKKRSLSYVQKLAYGVGHVLNDILGSIWFSYTLIFLQLVAQMKPTTAALLMFIGQAADATATPFVGILVDKCNSKKKWYCYGVLLVTISFPFVMQTWFKKHFLSLVYYIIAIVIFQTGWAVVQLSHLSLIPELTASAKERAALTSTRYSASVFSNIIVYALAYYVLRSNTSSVSGNIIGPEYSIKFEVLVAMAICIGLFCSVFFFCVLKTKSRSSCYLVKAALMNGGELDLNPILSSTKLDIDYSSRPFYRCGWLYIIALIHTTSRLFYTIGLVYFPFYINETAVSSPSAVAMAPFLCFLASLVASITCNYLAELYTNKVIFGIGSFFSLLGCACIYFNPDNLDVPYYIYSSSVCYGIGSSLNITASLCIAANFIGTKTTAGASIYSLITFSDKILSGICIMLIEYLKCFTPDLCEHYYKFILSDITGISVIAGLILILIIPAKFCVQTN